MTEDTAHRALRALSDDNAAAIHELRQAHIPQRVGMAAACRALAEDLPRALTLQVEAELVSGNLAERWELAKAAAIARGGDHDPLVAAAAALLRQHSRASARHLRLRGREWAAAAHRLEGQADALEAQNERLGAIVAAAAAPRAAASASSVPALLIAGDDVDEAREDAER